MMRPHVRGGTEIPSCLRAAFMHTCSQHEQMLYRITSVYITAYMRNSPSNGLSSCFLRIRLRVGKSTPGLLVLACDLSASACTPSLTHHERISYIVGREIPK